MLTYKRKLKLTKAQEQRIVSWIGACRTVYNMGLEIKITAWKGKQQNISAFDLMKQITDVRNDIEWINSVPVCCLQNSMERLDKAYKTFFKGGGFPKFKSKKNYTSILFKKDNRCENSLLITNNNINLPKIGEISFFKDKSPITGKVKTAQIIIEPTGFFICITCDKVNKNISNHDESQVIGLDVGITNFVTYSNGNFVENPKHFKTYERKLRIENRSLARKKKGSSRWEKQAKRVRLLYHKIGNVRKDFLHKTSTDIAKKYHTVYLEDLNISGMIQNGKLSKYIFDCSWGAFRVMLEYKTNVVLVNPKYTSQTCNECGCKDSRNRISQSEFVCINCGHLTNADTNAAKNILSKGVALNRKSELVGCALVEKSNIRYVRKRL